MANSASKSPSHEMPVRVTACIAAVAGVLLAIWAVWLAQTAVEPYVDSSRPFYAAVGDVLLGLGTLLLAGAVGATRDLIVRVQIPSRLEALGYVGGVAAVGPALAVSATNSLEASSRGQGGPALVLVAAGGIGVSLALALALRRRLAFGLVTAIVLASALLGAAAILDR